MVTQGLPRSQTGTGTLKARLFPRPPCVTLPGTPESSCPRWLHLWALTQPTQSKLFPHIFSSGVPCPSFLSEHSHHLSSSTHHWSLSSPTDLSNASHLCLSLSAESAGLLPAWLEVFWKLCFAVQYNDLGCNMLWSWREQWHPTPVLLPGKSHGWRSLVGCSSWGREESDTTEQICFHFSLSCIGEGNGNPLQCSCLGNPRDGGAWWAAVYGVTQSWTRLKQLSSSSRHTLKQRFSNFGVEITLGAGETYRCRSPIQDFECKSQAPVILTSSLDTTERSKAWASLSNIIWSAPESKTVIRPSLIYTSLVPVFLIPFGPIPISFLLSVLIHLVQVLDIPDCWGFKLVQVFGVPDCWVLRKPINKT